MTDTPETKRGRGRSPGFRMTEQHRDKIRNSNILNALVEHIEGKRDMSSSQVSAGLGLLRKVLPDLTEADIRQRLEIVDARALTDDELASIASGSSEDVASTAHDTGLTH